MRKDDLFTNLRLCFLCGLATGLLSLLLEEENIDVGFDSSSLNGCIDEEFMELVVSSDRFLDVSRSDSLSFILLAKVSSDLHDLSNDVLNYCGQSYRS